MADIKKDHARLLGNLKTLQKAFTAKRLSGFLGISEGAWHYRMKEPWKLFGYDDFKALSKFCKVDFAQLLEGTLTIK